MKCHVDEMWHNVKSIILHVFYLSYMCQFLYIFHYHAKISISRENCRLCPDSDCDVSLYRLNYIQLLFMLNLNTDLTWIPPANVLHIIMYITWLRWFCIYVIIIYISPAFALTNVLNSAFLSLYICKTGDIKFHLFAFPLRSWQMGFHSPSVLE